MYNENIKTAFINSYSESASTRAACEYIFNSLEPYETQWNADICTISANELQPIINKIAGMRVHSRATKFGILRKYAQWCIDTAKIPGAHEGLIDACQPASGASQTRELLIANPTHLQKRLEIYDKEDLETTDNIYRCYFWLAYGGVPEEVALEIKRSDVNIQTMVVEHNDEEYPIYREGLPAISKCMYLDRFVFNHPRYSNVVYKQRIEGDTLVRGVRGLYSTQTIRVELSRRHTGLSYSRVWLSGIFYRAYEWDVAGANMNSFFKKIIDDKTNSSRLSRDIIKDYEQWKLAFHR